MIETGIVKPGLENIKWDQIKLVIFDVDGTLYDQKKLRRTMVIEILKYYVLRPWKFKEIHTLMAFRKNRELLALSEETNVQYKQYLIPGYSDPDNIQRVKTIVDRWIRQIPLIHLHKYTFPGIKNLIQSLRSKGITVAILSDYHAKEKLQAMELDIENNYSSESHEINILKPHPKGINHILNRLSIAKEHALYIGDRHETDAKASERAGIQFLMIDRKTAEQIYSIINEKFFDVS